MITEFYQELSLYKDSVFIRMVIKILKTKVIQFEYKLFEWPCDIIKLALTTQFVNSDSLWCLLRYNVKAHN